MNTHLRSRTALGHRRASALALMLAGCGARRTTAAAAAMRPSASAEPRHHRRLDHARHHHAAVSGATAGPGTCTVAGITAYFGAKNADGRRRVRRRQDPHGRDQGARRHLRPAEGEGELRPAQGQRLRDDRGPGHADQPRLARGGDRRRGAAGADHDRRPDLQRHRRRAPGSSASCRSTRTRARRSASCSRRRADDHKVAILSQNDDYGKGYVEGFKRRDRGRRQHRDRQGAHLRGDRHLGRRAAHRARRQRRRRLLQRDVDHAAGDLVAAEGAGARLAAELVPALEHVEPDGDPRARRRRGVPRRLHRVVREGAGEPGVRRRTRTSSSTWRTSSSTATTRTRRRSRTAQWS